MECARNMILAEGLELEFWGETVNMAVYIKKWCPTKALNSRTPSIKRINNIFIHVVVRLG
jgi:hypothetical protein